MKPLNRLIHVAAHHESVFASEDNALAVPAKMTIASGYTKREQVEKNAYERDYRLVEAEYFRDRNMMGEAERAEYVMVLKRLEEKINSLGEQRAVQVDAGRWTGVVVGVGNKVTADVRFGDIVELPRWGGEWFNNPNRTFSLDYEEGNTLYENTDGPGTYHAVASHKFVKMEAAQLLWRVQRKGAEEPGLYPLADRMLVRMQRQPTESAGGIDLLDWRTVRTVFGEVLAVGSEVSDVAPGMWVVSEAKRGSFFERDGKRLAIVREAHLIGAWASEGDAPEWAEVRESRVA